MESEGFIIPIGGDLSSLQSAFEAVIAAVDRMGAQIAASFQQSTAAMMQSQVGANAVAAAQQRAGESASSASSKFVAAASTAGSMGEAMQGAAAAIQLVATASRVLTGVNLATAISGWIGRAGGLRAALLSIPAMMASIARSPMFRNIAIGAGVAVAGILAIRAANRVVSASLSMLSRTAAGIFRGIAASARAAANAASSAFKGLASMGGMMGPALPIAGLLGGLGGLAGAVTVAVQSVEKAAQMETLETAFAPLIGGAQNAKARIAELAKFAADTPFELPEVAKASRVLEVLTRGALSSGKALTMVGDVAAGVMEPVDELAMWIGRLYDGLQSGRPVGEALMRLQELGVVSGDVRSRIEALQKSGAAGPAIWKEAEAALGRFSGSMERQSRTWAGRMSNFRDSVGQVMALFGTPIIDALKPFLEMATRRVDDMRAAAVRMGNAIRDAFDFGRAAWASGDMVTIIGDGLSLAVIQAINSFYSGIVKSVAYLSGALPAILSGIAEGFRSSGILAIFQNLADAMASTISAAIMSSIGKVTGWAGWEQDAQKERAIAGQRMNLAKNNLEALDLGAGLNDVAKGVRNANARGMDAANKSGNTDLIDMGEIVQRWVENTSNARNLMGADRDRRSADAAALDRANLNSGKQAPGVSIGEAVGKAVAPAVMSLSRIGGGGMNTGIFSSLVGESRKQTGVLRKILTAVSKPESRVTAVYGS